MIAAAAQHDPFNLGDKIDGCLTGIRFVADGRLEKRAAKTRILTSEKAGKTFIWDFRRFPPIRQHDGKST